MNLAAAPHFPPASAPREASTVSGTLARPASGSRKMYASASTHACGGGLGLGLGLERKGREPSALPLSYPYPYPYPYP